jgi:hypothetical protein
VEVEVKASALGGAAMAGGGMWRRERGVASDLAAKRHGNIKSVFFSPFFPPVRSAPPTHTL